MTKSFYYSKGEIKNLKELELSLDDFSSDELEIYLKNKDFSNWIRSSLKNTKVAKVFEGFETKDDLKRYFSKKDDNMVRKNKVESEKKEVKEQGVKRHIKSSTLSYVSAEAPETFIMKEFLFGALFGLLLGLILMAMLISAGIYY